MLRQVRRFVRMDTMATIRTLAHRMATTDRVILWAECSSVPDRGTTGDIRHGSGIAAGMAVRDIGAADGTDIRVGATGIPPWAGAEVMATAMRAVGSTAVAFMGPVSTVEADSTVADVGNPSDAAKRQRPAIDGSGSVQVQTEPLPNRPLYLQTG